ncbi:MAG: TAT-variant-translocated molybdopterin oxidoreductase [Acidobacteriota bacterium]
MSTQREHGYWRSLETWAAGQVHEGAENEFPAGASEPEGLDLGRRDVLKLMGASLALAGAGTGCSVIRKPAETILPYAERPEDLIPGRPMYYATSACIAGSVTGMLVESHDGRPTKIEGNPRHPESNGGTGGFTQAEVLSLYDAERARTPSEGGAEKTLDDVREALEGAAGTLEAAGGAGLGLLVGHRPSPTFQRLLSEIRERFPQSRVYLHDPVHPASRREAAKLVGAEGMRPVLDLSRADVVACFDADLFGLEPGSVRNSRAFAEGRRLERPSDGMNRLYVAEPVPTVTGIWSDQRLRVSARKIQSLLGEVVMELAAQGARGGSGQVEVVEQLRAHGRDETLRAWARELAADLRAHPSTSVVVVGAGQPPAAQALGHLINEMIGAQRRVLAWRDDQVTEHDGGLVELASDLRDGTTTHLVALSVNAVHGTPSSLDMAGALATAEMSVSLSHLHDEMAEASAWHVPVSHFLESWGDWVTPTGETSVQQPLIAPLHSSLSEIEVLAILAGAKGKPRDWVQETAGLDDDSGENAWRKMLHDCIGRADARQSPRRIRPRWNELAVALAEPPQPSSKLELVAPLSSTLLDGRYATNGWLQELPDPITKLTWGQAALMSPATARHLGVGRVERGVQVNRVEKGLLHGDVVRLERGETWVEVPALIVPGVADGTVCLTRGYGRHLPSVEMGANEQGVDVGLFFEAGAPSFLVGVSGTPTGGSELLATTQERGTLVEPLRTAPSQTAPRVRDNIIRETELAEYLQHPDFVKELDVMPEERLHSLWEEPNPVDGHQWGMAVDLTTCYGCSACVIACQAENNIPVVGKDQVLLGREMHWVRVDRYYSGDWDDPTLSTQPVSCMHCENAPCEQVCPVAATVHSPEGTNDMAYNRCIGTRYCANNCPYKVRRFNYFNFAGRNHDDNELLALQSNPDVTVRFRGVIEKCTYCVQRIQAAKIDAKVNGDGIVADGDIKPACGQCCPTDSIAFGNLNDPNSRVSRLKARQSNYGVLTELNTQPRTTYLGRVRNPNPRLG